VRFTELIRNKYSEPFSVSMLKKIRERDPSREKVVDHLLANRRAGTLPAPANALPAEPLLRESLAEIGTNPAPL
jgi:hypothetical protein